MADVLPSFTVRLAAMGKDLNAPTAFNKARSFAASTSTTQLPNKIIANFTINIIIITQRTNSGVLKLRGRILPDQQRG